MRDALSSAPILTIFVHMSGNARRCLESPVTEVDCYKLQDEEAEKTQDMIRRLTYRIESLQIRGFCALSWGRALEDASRGAYIAGWRTIEVRIAFVSPRILLSGCAFFGFIFFPEASILIFLIFFFRRLHRNICGWARLKNTRSSFRKANLYSSSSKNSSCRTYTSSYTRPQHRGSLIFSLSAVHIFYFIDKCLVYSWFLFVR